MDKLFDQYVVLVPALVPLAYLLGGFGVYTTRWFLGRHEKDPAGKRSSILGTFWAQYAYWIFRPLGQGALRLNLRPNHVTIVSGLCAAGAGFAVATGHFAIGTWVYVCAGVADLIDGHIARSTGQQTKSGAFLDSVVDRWGELFIFGGLAWQLRGTWAMIACLLALGGSMMVSYTRARGESLGVVTSGGAMQRPERLVLVSLGCFIAALVDAHPTASVYVPEVLGTTLVIVGAFSSLTAVGRLRAGYRMLEDKAPAPRANAESHKDTPSRGVRAHKPVARVVRSGTSAR